MKSIKKHQFEAVSLLTTQHGLLDVAIVPCVGQYDWLIPTSMILSVDPFTDRIWNYLWQGHDLSVFNLCDDNTPPEKLIVLEGNTNVHRFALQVAGEIGNIQLRISDVTDIELDDKSLKQEDLLFGSADLLHASMPTKEGDGEKASLSNRLAYIFQVVQVNGKTFIIPDLDYIAHRLVDLDG